MQPSTSELGPEPICVVCGKVATVTTDPPRRTYARGPDPEDPSYAVIAVLPQMALCDSHYRATFEDLVIGWCDDAACRRYGEVGAPSPCGQAYAPLKR